MKILQLKPKQGKPFISETGTTHSDAVMVVSNVINRIIDKHLTVSFLVFNSINDVGKAPIDLGFSLSFRQDDVSETILDPQTNDVVEWGKPSYNDVLDMFDIVDNGIILNSGLAEQWFLGSVKFRGDMLSENWELIK